jgi:HNH endonuclease.
MERRKALCFCSGKNKKHVEEVRRSFEEHGYTLVSPVYINSKSNLEYVCPNGHRRFINWDSWKHGHRCKACLSLDINFIKGSFEREGYTLLSDRYINSATKLQYICPIGHRGNMKWNKWQQGHRCCECFSTPKHSFAYVKNNFEQFGYTLLSTEYVGSKHRLYYVCPLGHKHSMIWTNWFIGRRCPTCKVLNQSGANHYNWKGGISNGSYCDAWSDKEYKLDIKLRDNYTCQNFLCNSKSSKLVIHHIDYNKSNCHPSNLITICNGCNAAANHSRDWHQSFYTELMKRKLGDKRI